jgi:geranylgeranylglyceryl phosphate synthase family protein
MYDIRKWNHVFKLDPNKKISDPALEKICESGTDCVMVGGTDGVTLEGVFHLLSRVRRYAVPCALEVSALEAVVPGFDLYFIPSVLNSPDAKWIIGKQVEGVKEYGHWIRWDELVTEGYLILNEDCKAARLTGARTNLSGEEVAAYARVAEKMFHFPVLYLEYSGRFGDPDLVRRAKESLEKAVLFYGGGIRSAQQAEAMKRFADCIVVGNIIYEDLDAAIETVAAANRF